ncbi:MAG: alpha/beta hydrolase [Pseudomonadota bacterium]
MSEPLVFLPGIMSDARLFGPQISTFSTETSVMFAPISSGETIEEIASGLLKQLPKCFAVAGHGMGGIVAMELLRRAPERVSRIALMDTTSLAETPQSAADYEPLIIKLKTGLLEIAASELIRAEHLAPTESRASILNLVAKMAENVGTSTIIQQIRALQRRCDYQVILRKCKVPALVMCGVHDTLMPVKRHEFMAGIIPNAQLALIQNAGHFPTLEASDAVSAALRSWMNMPLMLHTKISA